MQTRSQHLSLSLQVSLCGFSRDFWSTQLMYMCLGGEEDTSESMYSHHILSGARPHCVKWVVHSIHIESLCA